MKVVLAEKKIQAEELAKPFPHKMAQGYIDISPCSTFPQGAVFVWASGHLIGLCEPEEYDPKYSKWNLQDLPIVPQNFKHKVDKTKAGLYSTIKRFVNDPMTTEVILGTDPGREGEYIGGLVLRQIGNRKPVKRLWTSSLAKSAVEQAFQNLLPESAKKNLYFEAYSRACADWLVGMNTSRLYSMLLQNKGIKAEGSFSTGRVQTPLLALIVERDLTIENFVAKSFWQVYADFEVNGKKYRGQWFKDTMMNLPVQKLSLDLVQACQGKPVEIRDVKKEQKQFNPPMLHNLSSLQTLANKRYRYSPQDVLDIVQGLYERGIVSYPRSDSQFVTEDEAVTFPSILEKMKGIPEFAPLLPAPVSSLIGNKRYVNPDRVSDHYAIIPTENVPKLSELEDRERNIYNLIARSLIAAHYNNAVFDFTNVITYVDGKFSFISKGKVMIQEGWRKVIFPNGQKDDEEDNDDSNDQTLPPLSVGENGHAASVTSKEGRTQPPKRYTEGDLIALMKNAGKSLDNQDLEKILQGVDGLGTEATRSGMIGKLKQQKYIEVKKNMVYATTKGRTLIQAVGKSILASAEMTAQWEKKLREVGAGNMNYSEFIEEAKRLTLQLVQEGCASVQHMALPAAASSSPALPGSATPAQSMNASKPQPLSSQNQPKGHGGQSLVSTPQQRPTGQGTPSHASSPGSEATGAGQRKSPIPDLSTTQVKQPLSTPSPHAHGAFTDPEDALYIRALWEVVQQKQASVSFLQRRILRGYTECAKLIDRMEYEGFISEYRGSEPRQILIDATELQKRYPRNQSELAPPSQPEGSGNQDRATVKPKVHANAQATASQQPKANPSSSPADGNHDFAPLSRPSIAPKENQVTSGTVQEQAALPKTSPSAHERYHSYGEDPRHAYPTTTNEPPLPEEPNVQHPPQAASPAPSEQHQQVRGTPPVQQQQWQRQQGGEQHGQQVQLQQGQPQRGALNMHDLGYCPKCGVALVVDKGKFYGCNAYRDTGCDYTLGKQILGVEITKEDVQALLNKGETPLKRGFRRANSDEYFDASIVLKEAGKISFKSPEPLSLKLPVNLLKASPIQRSEAKNNPEIEWIETATAMIKMPAKVKKVSHGPKVIRYEMLPESLKINISNYRRYKDNFQAALQAEKITLYSPIPGSNLVGIEVPNKTPYVVNLRGMLDNRDYLLNRKTLSFPIGVDMINNPVIADLAEMPHLLIAGATGAGKSVFLNALIVSLLYGCDPDELRFVMIDPKKVELSIYSKLPHLFCPIIIDPTRAIMALKALCNEMDRRYERFLEAGVRNIQSYNEKLLQQEPGATKMPYIVLIIDELADLMMQAAGDVESQIQRLSQLARAAGIHMIIATQRPTKQFLSPNIKGNLPVRLAFAVAAGNDSLVILDEPGAEDLLGKGDMFFKPKDGPKQRLVSAYVSDEEIENVVQYISQKYSVAR
ncbi:DNA topoisomerase 3 [Paenibacillus sp. Y412MC10]|uniref:DNA topoisomerase 3 n=1 Tax=Geobacillus sp. (strain Y412MC10) TaxID=481743 RepID=UPI0021B3CACB|nr:DNA topoisomerase 3 [Paenibacillus sp. Y412MC10]